MKSVTEKIMVFLLCFALVFSGLPINGMAMNTDTANASVEETESKNTQGTQVSSFEETIDTSVDDTESLYLEGTADSDYADTVYAVESAPVNTEYTEDYDNNNGEDAAVRFVLNPDILMYGEDGSNKAGNIDNILKPALTIDGVQCSSFSVDYKYFTDAQISESIDLTNYDASESLLLEDLNAGTVVYVCARAKTTDGIEAIAKSALTIQKRKISITVNQNRNLEVSKKDFPENSVINAEEEVRDTGISINLVIESDGKSPAMEDGEDIIPFGSDEAGTNNSDPGEDDAPAATVFAKAGELQANSSEILIGDVLLDVSKVDVEAVGTTQEVPADLSLAPEYDANYEIAIDPVGYVYVNESKYTVTFVAEMNGTRYTTSFNNDISGTSTLASFMTSEKKNKISTEIASMIGSGNAIYWWVPVTDGFQSKYTRIGASTFKNNDSDYTISGETDYQFTAAFVQKSSDNIYVLAIPDVYYDGRTHVSSEQTLKSEKSSVGDLSLAVWYSPNGSNDSSQMITLRYGKDYKVTYKNNKNASIKYEVSEGKLTSSTTYSSDAGRPTAIITGQGAYAGFQTTAYFEILPYNLGLMDYIYYYYGYYEIGKVSGIKNSYELKNGKVSGINPKVTVRTNYYAKSVTLKEGKDYKSVIYKYNSGTGKWDRMSLDNPNGITESGKYLYTAEGIGNYCGTLFGQEDPQVFNDGNHTGAINPAVCPYKGCPGYPCQFIVDDPVKDLANATVTIKKASLPYKTDYTNGSTYYTASDFGITVKAGGVPLTEGEHYQVVFDGDDFRYPASVSNNVWNYETSNAVYYDSVFMANNYTVRIVAKGDMYFGSKTVTKKVQISGIKINPKWFKLDSASLPYDGKYGSSAEYGLSYDAKVVPMSPSSDYAYSGTGSGSNPTSYNYEKAAPKIQSYAVCVMSEYDKFPGTYQNTVYPFGPGVDHSYIAQTQFKRTPITMAKAVEKGLISISSIGNASMNMGGAVPNQTKITFNGGSNTCSLYYSGQKLELTDSDGDATTVKISFTNNKKPGTASVFLEGDGKVFKGKAKVGTFSVSPKTVSEDITVIDGSRFAMSYGQVTQSVSSSYYYGTILAMMDTDKMGKGTPTNPKITLYQTYYKDATDYNEGRLSLAKLSSSQYKFLLEEQSGEGVYTVYLRNPKSASITGYNFDSNVNLKKDYTLYKSAAKITGITISYGGNSYEFPADSKTFAAVYTGARICPEVTQVKLNNGETLDAKNFSVEYGANTAVGKKGGTIKIKLIRNTSAGTFNYGGSATFNFAITSAPAVKQ